MSFWQRLLDSNQALPFIMAKKLLANQQNQCVLLCVPQSFLTKLKKLIAKRLKREGAASQTELTEEEAALYEEFVNVFEENEFVY